MKEGRKNVHFPTENWLYLGDGDRYGLGYYQSLIGSRIRRVRLDGNHWPWMTLKTVTRYCSYTVREGLSCYWSLIESYIIGFQMTWKTFTLNDLEDQYCNRNCIGCSVFSRARRFYCENYLQNLRLILSLFVYSVAIYIAWRNDHVRCLLYWPLLYLSRQRSVNIACMELCHFWQIAFSPWLKFGRCASDVGGTVGYSLR